MFVEIRPQKPNNTMIRPEEGSAFLLVIILSFMGLQLLVSAFYVLFTEGSSGNMYFMVATVLLHIMFIGLYFALIYKRGKFLRYGYGHIPNSGQEFAETTPKNLQRTIVTYAFAALIGVFALGAFLLPTTWFDTAFRHITGFSSPGIAMDTVPQLILGFVAIVLLAPISEELIFRGVLLSGLSRRHSAVKAVLLSALAFMLFHMNPAQTFYQFILGVIMGFAVLLSGKIAVGIVIHAVSNLTVFILILLEIYVEGFTYGLNNLLDSVLWNPLVGVPLAFGLIVILGGGIVAMLLYFKKTSPEGRVAPPLIEPYFRPKVGSSLYNNLQSVVNKMLGQTTGMNPFFRGGVEEDVTHTPPSPFGNSTNLDPFATAEEERNPISADPFGTSTTAPPTPPPTTAHNNTTAEIDETSDTIATDVLHEAQPPEGFELDPHMTQMRHENRMKAERIYFWASCGICATMWLFMLFMDILG